MHPAAFEPISLESLRRTLRKEVQREIELGVGALMTKRERDPERYPVQRLLRGLAARIG